MSESNKSKISIWVEAARLRTLPLSAAGIITGSALAMIEGKFDAWIFTYALLTTISLQVLSNFANDLGDAQKGTDHEGRVGPRRLVSSGLIGMKEIRMGVVIAAFVSFAFGVLLLLESFGSKYLGWLLIFLFLGLIAIWAAIKYTIGKSAYGYRGLGDLFVFVFFGLISVNGSYFLMTRQFDLYPILNSIAIGCLSTGVLHLNNMRDRMNDKASGKMTVSVQLGDRKSRIYFTALMLTATICIVSASLFQTTEGLLPILGILPVVQISNRVFKISDPLDFNNLLKPLALSAFFYSVLLFITALI